MTVFRAIACAVAVMGGALLASSGAYAQSAFGAPLFAVLNGGNECNSVAPPAGPDCRKGDLDGIGSATILITSATQLCYGITVDNIAGAAAAHIHGAVSGLNGPIVVALAPPNAPFAGNPGASSGCAAVAAATITALRADPTRFYVNVHNGAFAGGAVRGQLH